MRAAAVDGRRRSPRRSTMSSQADAAATDHDIPEDDAGEARLMTHAYDGIREYDNPLPGWWKAIFAGTIAFAAAYGFYFHVANWGTTPAQAYASALGEYEGKKELRDQAE